MFDDTKLSARWSPVRDFTTDQWQWPIQQVLIYSNEIQYSYDFLITDKELVVFQFAIEWVGIGIAAIRGVRAL